MNNKQPLPELLAPAGSYESLRAALAAGADAVYFGHSAFSNRMRAKNFTDESIRDAIKLCHDSGAAAHITVNTRIRDRERDELLRLVDILYGGTPDTHPDALIVADFGVARAIKSAYPDAVLHASTQTSLSSPADCEVLRELGFSRLVVPRELSYSEISFLVKNAAPTEIEMFIHGAHCVSLSGQCLMSYVQGGRSGNRGECAQPCRLPFSTELDPTEKDRLSLSDMCLGRRMTDVIKSGVASLKIEGRLKSPAYVYGVTSIYRRLLDEGRDATKNEINDLRSLFYRGFTDGYFASRYRDMSSTRVSGTAEKGTNNTLNETISKKLKERISAARMSKSADGQNVLRAKFTLAAGAAAEFTLFFGELTATATGDVPQLSDSRPITAEIAAKNLTKFGGTGYSLSADNIEFSIEDGLWLPVSSLNALRRDALANLEELAASTNEQSNSTTQLCKQPSFTFPKATGTENVAEIASLALFGATKETSAELSRRFDRIYVSSDEIEAALTLNFGEGLCASLPVITPDDSAIVSTLVKLKQQGVNRVLCHTVGQVRLVQKNNMVADMSFRANVTSTEALRVYLDLGCASVTLSPELPAGAMKNLGKELSADASVGTIAYGRFPVMTTARCLICGGKCEKGNVGGRRADAKAHLCHTSFVDRLGESFPVIAQPDCVNIIYNSTPIWMGDRLSDIRRHGAAHFHFIFTTESAAEAVEIFDKYSRGERSTGRRV